MPPRWTVSEKEGEQHGFFRTHAVGAPGIQRWGCRCSKCDAERVWNWDTNVPIQMMRQASNAAGWRHTPNGLVCPTCAKEKKMAKVEQPMINPKLQRKVYALLDDHFDETTKLYRSGWSDDRVAKEAETSVQFVEVIRRGAYGELAEDPVITALKQDNHKWWHTPDGARLERNKGELIALMHSELSEMLEAVRKDAMDDKLPNRPGEEVELADLFIRALDYAGAYKLDLDGAIAEKRAYNAHRKDHSHEERAKAGGKKF